MMAQLFNMPQFGSTMEEGLVVLWKRGEGEPIHKGETLLEVETDKTIVEAPAPFDGVLLKILAPPDTRVPIHRPIAILGQAQEDIAPLLAGLGVDSADHKVANTAEGGDSRKIESAIGDGDGKSAVVVDDREAASFAISPRARRLADERGVALDALVGQGTGPAGRVIERDVLAYLENSENSTTSVREITQWEKDKLPMGDLSDLALGLPGSQARPSPATFAAHSGSSRQHTASAASRPAPLMWETGATASMTLEVDMTACLALHAQLMSAVQTHYRAALDCVHIAVKATAQALETAPQLGAISTEDGLEMPSQVDIAVLTPVENELVTQVVERVGTQTLGAVSAALAGFTGHQPASLLAEKVKRCFTVLVLTDEVDRCFPPLPAGHAASLGLGRIAQRPVALNGQIVARTTMHLCLTYAAAAVDAALAARFLRRLKELMEVPAQILI
jgi:pyruvate/2-oxoglutarate dehydrogenase complex dihydrolipoamide acyltransferase (E2) component